MSTVLFAFLLTLFAGLSTGIGSALAFFTKRTNKKFLSFSLGLSAGVMIYVSMVEIFFKAKDLLVNTHGETIGYWYTIFSFFGGILIIAVIDKIIPSFENPHEVRKIEDIDEISNTRNLKLKRIGIFSAIAIAIHNFPEGMATFMAGMTDSSVALPIAIAIAIHNIPEGIAVSVPIYYSTGNKRKAFFLSFLSGLAEPVGALIGYLILFPYINDTIMGVLFGAVSGIMVFISLDELLPTAREFGEHHISIYGLVLGMLIMSVSLVLFV